MRVAVVRGCTPPRAVPDARRLAPQDDAETLSSLFPDISAVFGAKEEVKAKKGGEGGGAGAGAAAVPEKRKEVSYVDGKRSQNMLIAISKFNKIPLREVRDGIMRMDDVLLKGEGGCGCVGGSP